MTTEQLIVLGLFAAAFVVGWLTGALTWGRRRGSSIADERPSGERAEQAVDAGRLELDRAIRAYHAAVASSLESGRNGDGDTGPTLETLAHSLYALSLAVEHAAAEVEDHPLGGRLERTGAELRALAADVMAHTAAEPEAEGGLFDELEQQLISAASAILGARPAPASA